jgi:hypothetical protein
MQIVFADGGTQILEGVVAIRCGVDIIEAVKPEPPPVQWVSCRDESADVGTIKALIARYGYVMVEFESLDHPGKYHKYDATEYREGSPRDDLVLYDAYLASELHWREDIKPPQYNDTLIGRIVTGFGYE